MIVKKIEFYGIHDPSKTYLILCILARGRIGMNADSLAINLRSSAFIRGSIIMKYDYTFAGTSSEKIAE